MVRCADCGFLALRNARSRELDEADEPFRSRGNISVEDDSMLRHELVPICFARVYDLRAGVRRHITEQYDENERERWLRTPQSSQIHAVISSERECSGFTGWQQGFTPKEHREMLDRQELRDWQERQRRDDRRWRIIELILLTISAGVFTLLGALLSRDGFP